MKYINLKLKNTKINMETFANYFRCNLLKENNSNDVVALIIVHHMFD